VLFAEYWLFTFGLRSIGYEIVRLVLEGFALYPTRSAFEIPGVSQTTAANAQIAKLLFAILPSSKKLSVYRTPYTQRRCHQKQNDRPLLPHQADDI